MRRIYFKVKECRKLSVIFCCVLQTRLYAVRVMSELFARSNTFRLLVSRNMNEFLESVIGFRHSKPLPDPPEDAKALREQALEDLEGWNEQYGEAIPQAREKCFLK